MSEIKIPEYLSGGGEMGERIRSYPWSDTELGPVETWPLSLLTTLSIIINSRFPMFLYWGDDLIQFYNDAYRVSLGVGGKHPKALGQKAEECWVEVWPTIKPVIDQVMAGGQASWSEDQMFSVFRNGVQETVYWTYSYSPVKAGDGKVSGVFVTCTETTSKVKSILKLREREDQLRFAVEAAELGTWDYNPITNKFTANQRLKEWFGLPFQTEIELSHAFESMVESDRERVAKEIKAALDFASGGFYDTEYTIFNSSTKKERIVRAKGRAWFDDDKIAYRFNGTLQDITESVTARKNIEASESRLRNLVEKSNFATAIMEGSELRITLANEAALTFLGRTSEIIGRRLGDALPELVRQPFFHHLKNVFTNGVTFEEQAAKLDLERQGRMVKLYMDYICKPLLDSNGQVEGILLTGIDVTDKVSALRRIEESEQQVRSFVENAPFPIGVYFGEEMRIQLANQSMLDTWGKGDGVIGKLYSEILPELENQEVFRQLSEVFQSGVPFHAKNQRIDLVVDGKLQPYYFNYSFTPLFDSVGEVYAVMNTAANVTDLAVAKKMVEESEQRFRTMVHQAPIAIGLTRGPDMVFESINSPMLQLIDRTPDVIGKPLIAVLPELIGQRIMSILDKVRGEGVPFQGYEIPVKLFSGGVEEERYFDIAYTPLFEDEKVASILHVATDVTRSVKDRERMEAVETIIRNTAERLQMALDAGNLGSYELTIATGEMECTARYKANLGLTEHDQLDFDKLISMIIPEHRDGMRSEMQRAIREQKTFNAEYQVQWPDGTLRWLRAAGNPVYDDQGSALKMVGITLDITEQRLFSDELTRQVNERTMQLQRSNEDLLQFAHVTSHDLREPVRKIRLFTGRIRDEYGDLLPEQGNVFLGKVQTAASRMLSMIEGVLAYSTINSSDEAHEVIDLNTIINDIETDLEVFVQQKNASITKADLPQIEGTSLLIYQLFYNVINNALKFLKKDVPGLVTITAESITRDKTAFAKIIVSDNGIGFEQDYGIKIFNTFTRLNSKDKYEGTGLGLALCKRIVERHGGRIYAESTKGAGARFIILLPFKQRNA